MAGKGDTVLRLAAAEATSRSPAFALVALTRPNSQVEVEGSRPTQSTVAALIFPVRMSSVDDLAVARPRLVSSASAYPDLLDVYDVEIPSGARASFMLGYALPLPPTASGTASPVRSVELYDWSRGTWRSLPHDASGQGRTQTAQLQAGESQGGLVRVRVAESTPEAAQLQLVPESGQ
jgi:hypothetical protein